MSRSLKKWRIGASGIFVKNRVDVFTIGVGHGIIYAESLALQPQGIYRVRISCACVMEGFHRVMIYAKSLALQPQGIYLVRISCACVMEGFHRVMIYAKSLALHPEGIDSFHGIMNT